MHHTHCIFATELLSVDIFRLFFFANGYCHVAVKQARPFITNCLCIILIAFLQLSYCQSTFSAFLRTGTATLLLSRHDRLSQIVCASYSLHFCNRAAVVRHFTHFCVMVLHPRCQICNWIIAIKHLLAFFFCCCCMLIAAFVILGHFHSANFGVIPHLGLDRGVGFFSGFCPVQFFSVFFLPFRSYFVSVLFG